MNETKTKVWPVLDWSAWESTASTLHMFLQVVGKTRLELTPVQNHWWNVPLYVTARGLSSSVLPLPRGDELDIEFDFVDHRLVLRKSTGEVGAVTLEAQTVAAFFAAYLRALSNLGVDVAINALPVEVRDPIRFDRDTTHRDYDPDAAWRFWRVLSRADRLFKLFSTGFYGKISPVHFFWGSMDLAVTRFNGRRAPDRPGADAVQSEAYSHECISAGFWAGNGGYGKAAFYAYAAPVPSGLADVAIPGPGGFNRQLGEFVLDYDDVRGAADPDATVMEFLRASYSAAADSCRWDRASLDRTDALDVRVPRLPTHG